MDSYDQEEVTDSKTVPWQRPQAVLLSFCALHLLGRHEAIYSGSLVDVLARVGVGEHAARSTLSRMTRRGLFDRYRSGKRVYLGLTTHATGVLEEGHRRVEEPVNRDWDGHWTLLGFSLPESRRADRHLLRSRLTWAGFGLLQNGLWVTPRAVDVEQLLEGLHVTEHVNAFWATTMSPTDIDEMIADTWDLAELARGYREFLGRWDDATDESGADPIARQLKMHTEWLFLVRNDPRLPLEHLPADWPSVRAEHVFLRLSRQFAEPAARAVDELADRLPVGGRRHSTA